MAVPKKKTSVSRKRMRHSHSRLVPTNMSSCANCGALKRSHHVCHVCGYYKGRLVLKMPTPEDDGAGQADILS
jgi:large subunit ribosomal protein L32